MTEFNDISYIYETLESRVTTDVHRALNQQTTSTSVHLHTDLATLHCTIIFLCLSLSCFLESCSEIQVIITVAQKSCMHTSSRISTGPRWTLLFKRIPSARHCDDDYRDVKKIYFPPAPEPWDHDKLKSVGHESSIKGEKIWKYITLQLCSSCHERRSATLMTSSFLK